MNAVVPISTALKKMYDGVGPLPANRVPSWTTVMTDPATRFAIRFGPGRRTHDSTIIAIGISMRTEAASRNPRVMPTPPTLPVSTCRR